MKPKELSKLITQIEAHIECWKQFNHFIEVGRSKKFGPADENHFLEIKSVIVQELELIFAAVEVPSPSRDEVHALLGNLPSLRAMENMNEGSLRGMEAQWHKIYIAWHAILGQLKVKQQTEAGKSFWAKK